MNTISKIRWFWSWNDQQEEKWLHEMSAQGWHLKEVETPFWYTFEQGELANFVFRLDYHADLSSFSRVGWYALAPESKPKKAAEAEYQQLFKDAGWEYVGTNRGWRYFRQVAAQDRVQEIYTDNTSKIQMYRRRILYQLALLLLVLYFGFTVPQGFVFVLIIFTLVLAYPLLPLWRRIRQLQSET